MSYPMVRYPVLTGSKCAELSAQMVAGIKPTIEPHVVWTGAGEELNFTAVEAFARQMTREAADWTDPDRDRFEGKAAVELHKVLSDFPIHVLDDRGFWRYLSLKYFWEFIAWRERKPFGKGNYLKYIDATSSTESVLPRMFLRASAIGGPPYGQLAAAIPHSTDFWRSHVLRVRTAAAPPLARAFARRQAESRLSTDPLRAAARRLNRTWTNVVLHVYDDEEAENLVSRLWPDGDR